MGRTSGEMRTNGLPWFEANAVHIHSEGKANSAK
jgi:hypothetical protein